jgi:8-oxo-dGTP pyrophosphatase MutT (NUDIX family)
MTEIVCSGALFYSKLTKRILLLQKAEGKNRGTWGLVGGTNLKDENPWQGLQREIKEELGFLPNVIKTIPLETFISSDEKFNFHTYLCVVDNEFLPLLSSEHKGWAWSEIRDCPKPLHQGLRRSFSTKIIVNKLETVFEVIELI